MLYLVEKMAAMECELCLHSETHSKGNDHDEVLFAEGTRVVAGNGLLDNGRVCTYLEIIELWTIVGNGLIE